MSKVKVEIFSGPGKKALNESKEKNIVSESKEYESIWFCINAKRQEEINCRWQMFFVFCFLF